jgi:DNA-binding XRE family transcriptional regulator
MRFQHDERRLDFTPIGLAIKRAREAKGMTQEQLAYIVDRSPRTIMYNENDGQHPSLNTFYQMVTMFDISVDQYFYPAQNSDSSCRKRIDAMLNSLDEKDLQVVEATIQALKNARETEVK